MEKKTSGGTDGKMMDTNSKDPFHPGQGSKKESMIAIVNFPLLLFSINKKKMINLIKIGKTTCTCSLH